MPVKAPELPFPTVALRSTTIRLRLHVENNSKFVRGKTRALADIERYCFADYQMKKWRDGEYELTFTYRDDAHLDKQVYDLLDEIESQADARHCFTEADAREVGTERYW